LGGREGVEELTQHPFFAAIDWDALYERRLTPPFNPCAQTTGETDTGNFEREFTNMPTETIDNVSSRQQRTKSDTFSGFTFEEDSALRR